MQASTPRRLWAFARSLPPDSAWRRQGSLWTTEHELAAQQIERGDIWLRMLAIGQGRKPEKVKPMPRIEHRDRQAASSQAGSAAAEKRMSTPEQIQGFLRRVTGR